MGVLWAVFIASRRLADGAYRAKGAHERVRLGGGGEGKMWSQRGAWIYLRRGNLPTTDLNKLKRLAEDLKSSATFAAALAGDRELVKAWEAVEGMPASIRRDVFTIETVARHITETGKSPAAIAAELTASGTYDNWLADHLVTYLKNGHTLDKSSIDGAFATHIDVVETVSSNSVSGGHNRLAFLAECHVNNPTKRVVIISPRPLPSPPQAWEKFALIPFLG